jgi:hypothetical protein
MRFPKNVEAEIVILSDDLREDSEFPDGRITIGISQDDRVYYDPLSNHGSRMCNSSLILNDYIGELLIPLGTALQVTYTQKSIRGTIASPAFIGGLGDVDIKIVKDMDLELCLETHGPVMVNGKILFEGVDDIQMPAFQYGGRNYDHFSKMYHALKKRYKLQMARDIINQGANKDKSHSGTSPIIPYDLSLNNINSNIDVCIYYNLVQIEKPCGLTEIRYDAPVRDIAQEESIYEMKNIYRSLKHQLNEAKNIEDYRSAAKIFESMQKMLEQNQGILTTKNVVQ